MENMENMFHLQIEDLNNRRVPVVKPTIVEKALSLYEHLQGEIGDTSAQQTFKTSNG